VIERWSGGDRGEKKSYVKLNKAAWSKEECVAWFIRGEGKKRKR